MNVLDLFSGIGGFSLGLERAGMRTRAFCEIDPYCQAVLRKHWPDVPVYGDVRELTAARLVADAYDIGCKYACTRTGSKPVARTGIDLICGGFPCQDISVAGKGAGIGGERSGLWSEYARIIGEVRPKYCIVENVAALLGRGLERVLGDLAALGFDAEWHCIPASAVGAPHLRDRVWIIAYPQYSDANGIGSHRARMHLDGNAELRNQQVGELGSVCEDVADAVSNGRQGLRENGTTARPLGLCGGTGRNQEQNLSDPAIEGLSQWRHTSQPSSKFQFAEELERHCCSWWLVEPPVGRVAHGVPKRVDRLRALGNAVVPQIPELIGRAIMAKELAYPED